MDLEKGVVVSLSREHDPILFADVDSDWKFIELSVSGTVVSDTALPAACAATSGRYLFEMYSRARERSPDLPALIINPHFFFSRIFLLKAIPYLLDLEHAPDSCTIHAGADGMPFAYWFPAGVAPDFRLSFLSLLDAAVDSELLRCLGASVTVRHLPKRLKVRRELMREHTTLVHGIYVRLAKHAARVLSQSPDAPILAYLPYHAGDVLFLLLAAERCRPPVTGLIVNAAYADLARDQASHLTIHTFEMPLPHRNGWAISDGAYFDAVETLLPTDSLILYMRPSGDYNATEFHLIDHFAFALGASPRSPEGMLWRQQPPRSRPVFPSLEGLRLLLHFDAGWPLKIYPPARRVELISMLHEAGCEITVLSTAEGNYDQYREVPFSSYADLRALLDETDLVLGMDSFPVHLAAHVLGIPTVTLFGPTRPANSNAANGPSYVFLERALECRPCYGLSVCRRDGGAICVNFASPSQVLAGLLAVAQGQPFTDPGATYTEAQTLAGPAVPPKRPSRRLRGFRWALIIEWLRQSSRSISLHINEIREALSSSLRYDDPGVTWFKVRRYLRRRIQLLKRE